MKYIFTEKMLLEDIEENNAGKIIKFKSYLKEDFIEKALTIQLEKNRVSKIYFSSNKYGNASWVNGHGINEAHRWEDEDDLINISVLARRYPMALEDGHVSSDFAREKIIADVLLDLIDQDLAEKILIIIKEDSSEIEYDWAAIFKKNKELTNKLISDLIKANKFIPDGSSKNLQSNSGNTIKRINKQKVNLNKNESKKETTINNESKKENKKLNDLKKNLKRAESIAKKLNRTKRPGKK